ncbi:uncharacterized protein LOC121877390 isoform X1 [Homarus americanus]|uniref:uncharacterized protein LOC121877390 isoform X1 n=1 Tax=Homarus americanus TaxID=6706 RepID=UPI001C44971A|nr:uncharacterized protein LOC121877390 isoform X1 [Homarus americanus]
MLASRTAPAVAPRLLSLCLLLSCTLALLPSATNAASHPPAALRLLLPSSSPLHNLRPDESYPPEEEEVGVVVDPVIAQALLQLLSPPALGRRSSQPPPARPVLTLLANLARPPLKRDARQESLRLGWPKTSRVLKPIRPYLTKPKYFLENLRGKTNLGTVAMCRLDERNCPTGDQLAKKSEGPSWFRSRDTVWRRLNYILGGNLDQDFDDGVLV